MDESYTLTDLDFGVISDQTANVPPDDNVAYGSAPEQPSDPTGNGFGSWISGALTKSLEYAIQRDSMKMQLQNPNLVRRNALPGNYAGQQRQGLLTDQNLLLIGGAVLVFMLVSKGGK